MAKLRQYYQQQYQSSGNINAEFENIIRYLVGGERGGKSIPDLIKNVFDDNGEFKANIEMRFNPSTGLEYRVGEYDFDDEGWILLVSAEDLRGKNGANIGFVEPPFLFNRQIFIATAGQTTYSYPLENALDVMIFKNGLLLHSDEYSKDQLNDLITFSPALLDGDKIEVASVRDQTATNYSRTFYVAAEAQIIFPYPYSLEDNVIVFRNGILQEFGADGDYLLSSVGGGTLTFLVPLSGGDLVTFIRVENLSLKLLVGIMTEDEYTDGNGFIKYDRLVIEDEEIPTSKVLGLVQSLGGKANLVVSDTEPLDPFLGLFWLNTTPAIPTLSFYDGARFRQTTPDTNIPTFSDLDANLYIRVNSEGTALEYASINFSNLVPKSFIGSPSGVAPLGSDGLVPDQFLPFFPSYLNAPYFIDGSVTDGTFKLLIAYQQTLRLKAVSYKLGAGSASLTILVNGVSTGNLFAATTDQQQVILDPVVEVTGDTPKLITLNITGATTASDLEFALIYEAVAL